MSTRLEHGKVARALLACLLVLGACAENEAPPPAGLLTDFAGGVDADFSVEAFAANSPTLTIAAPVNDQQVTAGSPKSPLEMAFTVAFHDLAADKGKIRCYLDNKEVLTTIKINDPAANTIEDLGAAGLKTITCVLLDAAGNKLTNPEAFAKVFVYVVKPCSSPLDCEDNNACSAENCIGGKCLYSAKPACCKNSLECLVGETCIDANTTAAKCSACANNGECDDNNPCTTDSCDLSGDKGVCLHTKQDPLCCNGNDAECNDGKVCTADSCDMTGGGATGTCKHVQLPGVCCADSDCKTDDVCLVGACVDFECRFQPDAFKKDCCSTTFNSKCNDNYLCTIDACDKDMGGWKQCTHTKDPAKPDCCDPISGNTNECQDGNSCTYDVCADAVCVHKAIGDCCVKDVDCNDGNPCTANVCEIPAGQESGLCKYPKTDPLCCTVNLDCNDGKFCTSDTCNKTTVAETGTCQFSTQGTGCCDTDEQCDDGKFCTYGACVNHSCVFGPDAFKPNCCDASPDCNDGDACTIDSCDVGAHLCKAVPNGDPNCCNYNEDCDDNDCTTANYCDATKVCNFKKDPALCATSLDCDDNNPCTADNCDTSGTCGACIHTPIATCCLYNNECDDGKFCTADVCSGNKCQNNKTANCCEDDKDALTSCADDSSCTIDYCINHTCRHAVPLASLGCCAKDADCADSSTCTIDKCQNIVDGKGTCANIKDPAKPDCVECTIANEGTDCNDNNKCTKDACVAGKCAHQAVAGCCLSDFDCDDGQPCTTDACIDQLAYCIHAEYGGSSALCCSKATEATDCAYLNSECAKGVCETQADNSRKCVSQPVDICTVQVSYCQDFSSANSLKAMGWNPGDVQGGAKGNWKVSTSGGLGPDQYAELSWTPVYTNFDTCLQSPILQAAGSQSITLQYDQLIDFNKFGDTTVRILGSLDGANVDWTKATLIDVITPSADIPAGTLDLKLPPELTGSNGLRLAFCVAGKSTFDLTRVGLDNICVAKGGKPALSQCPPNQTVALFGSKNVPLKAKDPDVDAILSFSLVKAPSFVSLSSAFYFWTDGSWNSTLTIAPTTYAHVGTHDVTVKVSDGFLYSLCTFQITVTYAGGYLVWRPSVVPAEAGDALYQALKANYTGVVQHVTDLGLYPDLKSFAGIFITLGVFPDNHVLKESEVGALKLYLQGGGSIYLEAGDSWAFDTKTSLHPFFAVKPQGDSSAFGVTGPLVGAEIYKDIAASPTKFYAYEYAGGDYAWDNVNDQLLADSTVKDTRNVLRNQGDKELFWVQVAHQDPGGYKTVASSVLFGGVQSGVVDAPHSMIARIINFFNNGFVDCSTDAHCDDGNGCTADTCVSKLCKYENTCTCKGSGALACAGSKTFDASAATKTDVVDGYSCDSGVTYSGDEIAWEFTSDASKPVTLDITNLTGAGAKVFVLKASATGCDPAQCIGKGTTQVKFAAAKGAKYFIVLDATGTATPKADIAVSCGTPEICDDGQDNNANGQIDCADLGSCCGDAACGEICDDQDNDCDGATDESCDDDGDDYCDGTMTIAGKPAVCPSVGKDCNDDNTSVNPGVAEICLNGKDDNCDGNQDEEGASGCTNFWVDLDKDGFGTGTPKCLCAASGAYQASKGGDCNDADPKVNPADQPEICNNGLDDDCTGSQNDLNAVGCSDFYTDLDKDGWGTAPKKCLCFGDGTTIATKVGDCDDIDASKNPGKVELCNGKDDDCDFDIDEGCDDDKDGYCDADLGYAQVAGVDNVCGTANEGATVNLACKSGSTITEVKFASYGLPAGSCGSLSTGACHATSSLQKLKDACLGKASCAVVANNTTFGDPCGGITKNLKVEVVCTSATGAPPAICPKGPGDTKDTDPDVNPAGKEICDGVDNDSDGEVDEGCDDDNDDYCDKDMIVVGAPTVCPKGGGDCADAKTGVNPGMAEDCNTPDDDNCDGETNTLDAANCTPLFYDGDGDKYGTKAFQCMCSPVGKYTAPKTGDCDDANPALSPGNAETCDDADNNCDGVADEGCDDDNDGWCDAALQVATGGAQVCPSGSGDCADADDSINPGKAEVCGNNLDDNCDGSQNDAGATGCTTFYADGDGDGFGTATSKCLCEAAGTFTATNNQDCKDDDKSIKPGAVEVCDNLDNDCDGTADNGCDDDNDDYCDSGMTVVGSPTTCSKGGGDCNDTKASVNPGVTSEVCDDLDDDCDGVVDTDCDKDKDGYCDASFSVSGTPKVCLKGPGDCNDVNNDQNPGAPEVCGNGIDDDCDGSQNDENATNCKDFYFDGDKDTYGLNLKKCLCQAAGSFVSANAGDCADTNKDVHPGAAEVCGDGLDNNCDGNENDVGATGCTDFYLDQDGDGFGISGAKQCLCTADGSYKATKAGDCHDTDKNVSPGKTEICNNIDDNCDGKVDEGCNDDADGYCDAAMTTVNFPNVCVKGGGDCKDTEPKANPGEAEACDNIDNNCSGQTDEGCDDDNDDYCDSAMTTSGTPTTCSKGGGDCKDDDGSINPGKPELCATLFDDDCDGSVNDENATGCKNFGIDADGDNFTDKNGTNKCLCTGEPPLTGTTGGDCNDKNKLIHPAMTEICDDVDNNCNGQTDEGCDDDNDDHCDANIATIGKPSTCSKGGGDCNDTSASIHPSAAEICGNTTDENCDGDLNGVDAVGCSKFYLDGDSDGWGVNVALCLCSAKGNYKHTDAAKLGDCDDTVSAVNPGAVEVCGDGLDSNCNGTQNDPNALSCKAFYKDADKDGYGGTVSSCLCVAEGEFITPLGGDCNEGDVEINPGAAEMCDGKDNNCKDSADEGCDDDNDDYCDKALVTIGAPAVCPKGGGDCNDTSNAVYPAATEVCDNLDQDCDGSADNGCDNDSDGYCAKAKTVVGSPAICTKGKDDCDDNNSNVNPGKSELCDNNDNNCNGTIDEDCDGDGDGYCTNLKSVIGTPSVCPSGAGDCNDADKLVNPGTAEQCNGYDDNCAGGIDEVCNDKDGDGYCVGNVSASTGCPKGGGDCDDGNANLHPGASEDCLTPIDDNCNGLSNEENALNCKTFFQDSDGDLYGTGVGKCFCEQQGAFNALRGDDCDENDDKVNPGAAEVCDGKNNDCDFNFKPGPQANPKNPITMETYSHGGGYHPYRKEFWYPNWSGPTIYRYNASFQYIGNFNGGQYEIMDLQGDDTLDAWYSANWGYATITRRNGTGTGAVWSRSIGSTAGGVAVDANYVYGFRHSGNPVYRWDKNGNNQTTFNLNMWPSSIYGGTFVHDGKLWMPNYGARTYHRFDLNGTYDGTTFSVAPNIYNGAWTGSEICVSANNNQVYCYKPPTGASGYTPRVIGVDPKSHGGGFSLFHKEYWYPEWSGGTVWRYDSNSNAKGSFDSGQSEIRQLWGPKEEDAYYIARFTSSSSSSYIRKLKGLTNQVLWTSPGTAYLSGVASEGSTVYAMTYNSNTLYRYNATNGTSLGNIGLSGDYDGDTMYGGLAVIDGKLYRGTVSNRNVWRYTVANGVHDGVKFRVDPNIYGLAYNGDELCFNTTSGTPTCYKPPASALNYLPNSIGINPRSHGGGWHAFRKEYWYPEYAGGTIYRYDDKAKALGSFNSSQSYIWQVAGELDSDVYYLATGSSTSNARIRRMTGTTSSQAWESYVTYYTRNVAVDANYVYTMRSDSTTVYRLNKSNGSVANSFGINTWTGNWSYGIAVQNGVLWRSDDGGNIWGYNASNGQHNNVKINTGYGIITMADPPGKLCVSDSSQSPQCYDIASYTALAPTTANNMEVKSYGGGYHAFRKEWWYPEWSGTVVHRYDQNKNPIGSFDTASTGTSGGPTPLTVWTVATSSTGNLGSIPGKPGASIVIKRLGICGDSDYGSGPNRFNVSGAGLSFSWATGQSGISTNHWLSTTPTTSGSGRGFSYASVNYTGAVGQGVSINYDYHNDWDGRYCYANDAHGNWYSDGSSTVRAWVEYQYSAGSAAIDSMRQVVGETDSNNWYAARYDSNSANSYSYINKYDGMPGTRLWTTAGTQNLSVGYITGIGVHGSHVYVMGYNSSTLRAVRRSDGVRDSSKDFTLSPFYGSYAYGGFTILGDKLYRPASDNYLYRYNVGGSYDNLKVQINGNPYAYGTDGVDHCFGYSSSNTEKATCYKLPSDPQALVPTTLGVRTGSHGGGYHPYFNEHWYPQWSGGLIQRYNTSWQNTGSFDSGMTSVAQLVGSKTDTSWYAVQYSSDSNVSRVFKMEGTNATKTWTAPYVTTLLMGLAMDDTTLYANRYDSSAIYKFDRQSGAHLGNFNLSGNFSGSAMYGGLAIIGSKLYRATTDRWVYRYDLATGVADGMMFQPDIAPYGLTNDGSNLCFHGSGNIGPVSCYAMPTASNDLAKRTLGMDSRGNGGGYHPFHSEYWYPQWNGDVIYRYSSNYSPVGNFAAGIPSIAQVQGEKGEDTFYLAKYSGSSSDSKIYKLKGKTSTLLWASPYITTYLGGVGVDDKFVYTMPYSSQSVYRLHKDTGAVVSQFNVTGSWNGGTMYGTLTVDNGRLYRASTANWVDAYDLTTGAHTGTAWQLPITPYSSAFNGKEICYGQSSAGAQIYCYSIYSDVELKDEGCDDDGDGFCDGGQTISGDISATCPKSKATCDGTKIGDTCYKAVNTAATWTQAQDSCATWGGNLVSLASSAEADSAHAIAGAACGPIGYWIGATDKNAEGVFAWISGESLAYQNWASGEPTSKITGGLFVGGSLLTTGHMTQLNSWYGNANQGWKLCYKKSTHGNSSYTFHSLCDNKGPTISVIRAHGGNLFGGYTAVSWDSGSGYSNDSTAWLFSLTSGTKHVNHSGGGNATYRSGGYGPTFGGGHDLYIDSSMSGGYTYFGYNYACPVGSAGSSACQNYLGGNYSSWGPNEVEVYYRDAVSVSNGSDGVAAGTDKKWSDEANNATRSCFLCERNMTTAQYGNGDDCNDLDPNVGPNTVEICDGKDNNCNSQVDEGCDDDKDGYCDATMAVSGSPAVCPAGGNDCNDFNKNIAPNKTESCLTAYDDNCDGSLTAFNAAGCVNYYYDGDSDGYGTTSYECHCTNTCSSSSFQENFDGSVTGWTTQDCAAGSQTTPTSCVNQADNKGWHVATNVLSSTPAGSLYYGDSTTKSFNFGASAGRAVSPEITLPNSSDLKLRLAAFFGIEADANNDKMWINVLTNNGATRAAVWDKSKGTNTAFPNSKILASTDATKLNSWYGNPGQTWSLCYQKSRDGASSYTFHNLCNGRGPTITVIKVSNGRVFGGFTPSSWDSGSGYTYSGGGWLYSLTGNTKHSHYRYSYMQYNTSSYGPTFGGGHDLYLDSSMQSGYTNLGHDYDCAGNGGYGSSQCQNYLAGQYSGWQTTEVEVYYLGGSGVTSFPTNSWQDIEIDLSAFKGQKVQLEWYFNTVNSSNNTGLGVAVDNVRIVDGTCSKYNAKQAGDCDDANPLKFPSAAAESCDGVDNNCNGVVDEQCDVDGDGYCGADKPVTNSPACPKTGGGTACTSTELTTPTWDGTPITMNNYGAHGVTWHPVHKEYWHTNWSSSATIYRVGEDFKYKSAFSTSLYYPRGIAADPTEDAFYAAEYYNYRVVKKSKMTDSTLWNSPSVGDYIGGVAVDGDGVYAMRYYGTTVWVYNRSTGAQIKTFGLSGTFGGDVHGGLAVLDGKLYRGTSDNWVRAYNLSNGAYANVQFTAVSGNYRGFIRDGNKWCADYSGNTWWCYKLKDVNCSKGDDCNDLNKSVAPGAAEVCDGADNNCNGQTDEGCDDDNDDYCDIGMTVIGTPPTCTKGGGDCNDTSGGENPGSQEICNGKDDNCDKIVDPATSQGCADWYYDGDQDGYGVTANKQCLCASGGLYTTKVSGDCDDTSATAKPGGSEICDDRDNNCNGAVDEFCDNDNDDYCTAAMTVVGKPATCPKGGNDCHDGATTINPGVVEKCNNVDDNCNGITDENASDLCTTTLPNSQAGCVAGQCVLLGCDPGFEDINGITADGCECNGNDQYEPNNTCAQATTISADLHDGSPGRVEAFGGRIVTGADFDWYRIYARDIADGGSSACDNFRLRFRFTKNPGDYYKFDVYRGACPADNVNAGLWKKESHRNDQKNQANQVCCGQTDFNWFTNYKGYTKDYNVTGESEFGQCNCTTQTTRFSTRSGYNYGPSNNPGNTSGGPYGRWDAATGVYHTTNSQAWGFDFTWCHDDSDWYYVKVFKASGPAYCGDYTLEISNGVYNPPSFNNGKNW